LEKTDAESDLMELDSEPSVPQKKSKSLFKNFFS